jgi:acyl dehydratase
MTRNADLPRSGGLYFEEFYEGLEVSSSARTITETDVVNFAALSGDWNQLHTDAEFAKDTPFGQRIAHGLLVLSIVGGLVARMGTIEGTVEAFRELQWKFRAPVFIGDTVHLVARVVNTRAYPRLNNGMVTLELKVINQRDQVVHQGTWLALVRSRPK